MRRPGAYFFFTILWLAAAAARACPTCKDALSSSPEAAGLARGFYVTILLMLGVLFSLVGLLAWKIVRESRSQAAPQPPAA